MPEVRNINYTIKVYFALFDPYDDSRGNIEIDSFQITADRKLPISNTIRNQAQLNRLIFGNSDIQNGSDQELIDNPTTQLMVEIAMDTMDNIWHSDERLEGYTNPGMVGGDLFDNINLNYSNKTITITANYFQSYNNNNNSNNNTNNNNTNNNNNNDPINPNNNFSNINNNDPSDPNNPNINNNDPSNPSPIHHGGRRAQKRRTVARMQRRTSTRKQRRQRTLRRRK